ncbi:MAG TPA: hypothetical protein VIK50_09265 [Gemmatimonadaceae bacterium]
MRVKRTGLSAIGVLFTFALPVAGAQTAIACVSASGTPPGGITVAAATPSVVVKWSAVTNARGYAVARRNPDGTCWNLTPQGTTTTSVQEPIPTVSGTYGYQVAVQTLTGSTGVSQWVPLTVAATLSTTTSTTTVTVAPRTVSLAGFAAVGTSTVVAPRSISLAGFTAKGTSTVVTPRSISLAGFTAKGTSTVVAARTISLAGWTGVGQKKRS